MADSVGTVRRLAAELRTVLAGLEPGSWTAEDAATVAEELATTENACAAAKVRMAQRAAHAGAHRARGYADTSDWVASSTGTTMREARRQLDALAAVDACPETRDAMVSGQVSIAQALEIAHAVAASPGCEEELLDLARRRSLGAVRERARSRRLEGIDPDELYARQYRAREFRSWNNDLGMVCGSFALTPDVGVAFLNRIRAETDRRWQQAARDGGLVGRAAYAADALVALTDGPARTTPGVSTLNVVIDWPALARGHAHPDERSHVIGSGPVPPRVVRELCSNAFVKAIMTDGVEVSRVLHLGRRIPAEVRTALDLGPPPEFAGVTCSEAGCERRYGLEWDHAQPLADGGPTSLGNLQPLCAPHHREKTRRDRAEGWRGS